MEHDTIVFNWMVHFPPEILQMIFSFISTAAWASLCQVSKGIRMIALAHIDELWLPNEWHAMKAAHLMPNVKKFKGHLNVPSHLGYLKQLPELFSDLRDLDITVDDSLGHYFKLPDSLTKLTNLERLKLGCYGNDNIMANIALHCTKITSLTMHGVKEQYLLAMTQLKEFSGHTAGPNNTNYSKLSNLQKLKGPLAQLGIEKLQNLRVFYADTYTPNLGTFSKILRQLPNLERLGCSISGNDEELANGLKDMTQLTHLSVQFVGDSGQSKILTDLTQLRSLKILSQVSDEIVSQLTWLTKLKVYGKSDLLEKICTNLTRLKYFKFGTFTVYYGIPKFSDHLTQLQQLETLTCDNVTMTSPENFRGILTHLQKLKRVEITCNELDWRSLKKLDWRPIQHVVVNYMTIWSELK